MVGDTRLYNEVCWKQKAEAPDRQRPENSINLMNPNMIVLLVFFSMYECQTQRQRKKVMRVCVCVCVCVVTKTVPSFLSRAARVGFFSVSFWSCSFAWWGVVQVWKTFHVYIPPYYIIFGYRGRLKNRDYSRSFQSQEVGKVIFM